jgi:hypothetical protein
MMTSAKAPPAMALRSATNPINAIMLVLHLAFILAPPVALFPVANNMISFHPNAMT